VSGIVIKMTVANVCYRLLAPVEGISWQHIQVVVQCWSVYPAGPEIQ